MPRSSEQEPIKPFCQSLGCENEADNLLASKKNGLELHLCDECAEDYHEQGWRRVKGNAELQ